MLVKLTMEAKERKCVGCEISCFQDEDFEEAKGPPIQWRARKREGAPPNSSNASEPEPGGDGKRLSVIHEEECHRKKERASEG